MSKWKQFTTDVKNNKKDTIVFLILWGLYSATMLLLFHRQTVHYAGGYESDMNSYVLYVQGVHTGNPYAYPFMFWVAKVLALVLPPAKAVAFAVAVLNALTPLALKLCGYRFLRKWGMEERRIGFTLLLFGGLFVSMLFWPFSEPESVHRYVGVFSPNPFHNATYLAARGFSVISFFAFLELLDSLQAKEEPKKYRVTYVMFSVSLLLTTMTKPSFTLGFGVAAAIMVLFSWLKNGFKEWKKYLWIAVAVVPTLLDLLYQYKGVFSGKDALGAELGVDFRWLEAWHSATDCVLFAVLLGLAFPFLVLLCNLRELKSNISYSFTWAMMVANFFLLACLYEKGWRAWHMNFAWGYMYGMFYIFFMSLMILWRNTLQKKQKNGVLALQWVVFALHLICGMIYFVGIMNGGTYA